MKERNIALGRIGIRVGAGLAGIAASACMVAAAFALPLPSTHTAPASRTVTPVPATASAACAGPLLSLASSGSATSLTTVGTANVVSGGAGSTLAASRLATPDVSGGSGPSVFTAPAASATHEPVFGAAQSVSAGSSEISGFAAANCAQPGFDQWLVGGATSLGSTTLVVLSNPGAVAATVNLSTFSEQGTVQAAGGNGILVQPRTQRVIPLVGLAPGASATIVHVTSTGGTVSAQLQQSLVSGITTQGVEWVGPTAPAADHLVIPGAAIDTTALSAGSGSDAEDAGVPVLRVMPVGTKDAKLTISAKPEAGTKGNGAAATVTVGSGSVSEVPIDGLSAGSYTITVDSDVPIVAAVRTTTVDAKAGTDFAWYVAAQALTGAAAVPLAPGPGLRLHLVNPTGSAITVAFAGDGDKRFTVPAGGSIGESFDSGGVLTTQDAQGLYASVSYAAAGKVAGYVAYPTSASASALTVYRR